MNKTFVKSFTLIMILALIILAGLGLTVGVDSARAETSSYSNDYLIYYFETVNDNHILFGLDIGIDFDAVHAPSEEVTTFKQNLILATKALCERQRLEFITKSQTEEGEKYPIDKVLFTPDTSDEEKIYFGYTIEFPSFGAFEFYMGNVNRKLNEGFLMSKLTQTVANERAAQQYMEVKTQIASAAGGLSFAEAWRGAYNPTFLLDFITANGRVRSNAAERAMDSYGYYHHFWDLLDAKTESCTITLNIVNSGWWYLFGMLIPLAVMAGVIIFIKCTKKKDDAKQQP